MTSTRLSAFQTFLETRRLPMAESLANDLSLITPMSIEQCADTLQTWFAALNTPEDSQDPTSTAMFNVPSNTPFDRIATSDTVAVYQQHLMDLTFEAVTSNIDGAVDGTRALMALVGAISNRIIASESIRAQAQAQRLEQFIVATPLSVIEFDTTGSIRMWNPGAERIFGWKAAEVIGRNVIELLVSSITLDQIQGVIDTLLSGTVAHSRNENITKDGRIRTCQWYNAVLRDTNGNVTGVLSQTEDVTEQVERERHLQEAERALRSNEALLMAVLDNSPSLIHVKDPNGVYILVNRQFTELLKSTQEGMLGKTDFDFLPVDNAEMMRQHDREIIASNKLFEREIDTMPEFGDLTYSEVKFPIYDRNGVLLGTCGISTDITARKRAERERVQLQEQIIANQQAALRELSTPLIPLAKGLVIMPLIGNVDSWRAQQVIETLLQGVSEHHASVVILDITGVLLVDTQVAGALLRAAQAVKLLGAQIVLTGIRPEIAQTLVGLGLDLRGITTRGTLQDGIAYALGREQWAMAS
ncbi:MAG: PAS domain S-box protein [Roseiflexaceae bacterium]|nr:PAS domain S-box protein [Roseiflexaceae bacterium]